MSESDRFEILPQRSLAAKYWDYVCAAILLVPLVLMAFQGDILFGIAERINYRGWYTTIHQRELELQEAKGEQALLEQQRRSLSASGPSAYQELNRLRVRAAELVKRQDNLTLEIKSLRKPFEDQAAYWNFSFVRHWPLGLLLGPLLVTLLWFAIPVEERRRMYRAALETGARRRGLFMALAAMALFWFGVWQQSALARELLEHQGTPGYQPAFGRPWAFLLNYVSLGGWSAAAVYAFAGRPALARIWAPLAVIMALIILNYGRFYDSWTYMWDTKDAWSYGYLIGPIAAALFYFKLAEGAGVSGAKAPGAVEDVSLLALGPMALVKSVTNVSPTGINHRPYRSGLVLLGWGILGAAGAVAAWYAAGVLGRGPSVSRFLPVPLAACGALLVLGAWQAIERQRRGDLAMRLAGLVIVLASLVVFGQAMVMKIRYFQEITIIGVLLGGVLAVFGYQVFRVAWLALAFLYLAIPWPERTYVTMAIIPQKWAAEMAVRFMQLIYGPTVTRDGTEVIVGPTMEDRLTVAEQCSGLQMLFAFVALSVVYAYIAKRPAWRRAVIVVSSFPIAVAANFARVTIMALCYRLGFKEVTQGLTHEMAGFVIMLPLAFLLLYVEMRLLDFAEKLAEHLAGENKSAGGSAGGPQPPDETAVPGGAA